MGVCVFFFWGCFSFWSLVAKYVIEKMEERNKRRGIREAEKWKEKKQENKKNGALFSLKRAIMPSETLSTFGYFFFFCFFVNLFCKLIWKGVEQGGGKK